MMTQLAMSLNKQLANLNVLYVKLQHYHWYVKGQQFFVLHDKFQHLYEELPPVIDELAERILMIGGQPIGTLRQFAEQATIQEAAGNESAETMITQLERDYVQLSEEMKQAIQAAEQQGDVVTADLLTGITAACEKNVWLLRSYAPNTVQHV